MDRKTDILPQYTYTEYGKNYKMHLQTIRVAVDSNDEWMSLKNDSKAAVM